MRPELLEIVKVEFGCAACKHLQGLVCSAFPRGIPSEIQMGAVPHDRPYPGDGGIQFEVNLEYVRERVPSFLED